VIHAFRAPGFQESYLIHAVRGCGFHATTFRKLSATVESMFHMSKSLAVTVDTPFWSQKILSVTAESMNHISKSLAVTADTLFWGKNTLSATADTLFRISNTLSAAADTPFSGQNTPSATDATMFRISFAFSAAADGNLSFKNCRRMEFLTIYFIMNMNAEDVSKGSSPVPVYK
jgi:hypothetical protein